MVDKTEKSEKEIMSVEKVTHKQWNGLTGPTLKEGQTEEGLPTKGRTDRIGSANQSEYKDIQRSI
eukprot:CAMPEP_0172358112 /NCGR_PEP_ID=MMETSP1060-20121228/2424_1 /TAXON_ID=37318 /ORGANISM="Pseudo-nitzschia pungens, Strain cf. cingulata" /LENGTH=64 /DNA_ID=CAMNT_0013079137 /DNA_START=277 /DNA_END=471 /DNA_ORIENTATION=+